jgi:hypothetical protein
MSAMSDLHTLTDEREELVICLAEMAGILRDVRATSAAEPVLCLLDCSSRHWIRWGRQDRCTNCGTPALPASTWHRLLVEALRASAARAPWRELPAA